MKADNLAAKFPVLFGCEATVFHNWQSVNQRNNMSFTYLFTSDWSFVFIDEPTTGIVWYKEIYHIRVLVGTLWGFDNRKYSVKN